MLRIDSIHIFGFKDFSRSCKIKFADTNLTVLFGDNGSGKTTLLRILIAFLSKDDDVLKSEKVNKIIVNFQHNDKGLLKKQKVTVIELKNDENSAEHTGNIEESLYDWDEFNNSKLVEAKSISKGIQRGGISLLSNKIESEHILNFFSNTDISNKLNVSVKKINLIAQEFIKFSNSQNRLIRQRESIKKNKLFAFKHVLLEEINIDDIEYLLTERYRKIKEIISEKIQKSTSNTLDQITNSHLSDDIPDQDIKKIIENKDILAESLTDSSDSFILKLLKIIIDIEENRLQESDKLLVKLLLNIIDELNNSRKILNSIDELIKTYNSVISKGKELVINEDDAFIKISKRKHNINQLSSGEINLLIFLTIVLIDDSKRDFIIIDEPEISLNIEWQRKIMGILSKYTPNTQMIVATHSPVIGKELDTVVEVKVKEAI